MNAFKELFEALRASDLEANIAIVMPPVFTPLALLNLSK